MILETAITEMLSGQEKPALLPKVERFAESASASFQEVLIDLAESYLSRDVAEHDRALRNATAFIAGILTLADLTGRRSMLMQADRIRKAAGEKARAEAQVHLAIGNVPVVEFAEAIADIVKREPRLARSAAEVSNLYATRHAFAMAKSADMRVTRRVQDVISRSLQQGKSIPDASAIIREIGDFTQAYAETVFHTNASTAFTAGEFKQAYDPEVADVIPAFEFSAVMDADTRPNHGAAHGLIASTDDPVWDHFSPPLGYRCRCAIISRDKYTLERMGLIDQNGRVRRVTPAGFDKAHPDPGFGMGRPDRRMYQEG